MTYRVVTYHVADVWFTPPADECSGVGRARQSGEE